MILGINSGHDAGAAILVDGSIVAAADEERFKRKKHFKGFPDEAIVYCLSRAEATFDDLDGIAVSWNSMTRWERATFISSQQPEHVSPLDIRKPNSLVSRGFRELSEDPTGFPRALTEFIIKQLHSWIADDYDPVVEIEAFGDIPSNLDIWLVDHHEAHAANAYYCCGSNEALIVTLDGAGDDKSGSVWIGKDGNLTHLQHWDKSGSLGFFYAVVTEALGWLNSNGEGKTMGLAAFEEPTDAAKEDLREFVPVYRDGELIEPVDFNYRDAYRKGVYTNRFDQTDKVKQLVERHGRKQVAAAAQALLEEQVIEIVQPWIERTNAHSVATSGGVFLNVKLNSLIKRKTDVEDYFIFPNAGDGGLPVGAAFTSQARTGSGCFPMELRVPYLGPDLKESTRYESVTEILEQRQVDYMEPDDVIKRTAELLLEGRTVAWCQGRMEYGPRALGNRSVLVDPTREASMHRVNNSVKFRDSWRPFAPSIVEEAVEEYLEGAMDDPFMISSATVRPKKRSEIPAVTHVDGTARPQIVKKANNPRYWRLIQRFGEMSGTPIILNTSFNLSGDPIVCSARDALRTFYDSGLDILVLNDYILKKPKLD